MKKPLSVNKKSRGRPKKKGGVYPVTAIRLSPATGAEVDKWAGSQADTPTRSEAIRRLVELGLTVKTKARPTGRLSAALVADLAAAAIDSLGPQVRAPARPVGKAGRRLRAQELAAKTIEKIIDPAAPPEERAQRRRRLTKGPTEFRDARVDQPKAKGK
jgi:hypothetical protein